MIDSDSNSISHSGQHKSITSDQVYQIYFQDEKFITYRSKLIVTLSLTPKEIAMVRRSWQLILSDSKTMEHNLNQNNTSSSSFASSLFCHQLYDNLLDMKPELIDMFPSIKHQAVAFAGIMNVAIINLERLEVLDSILEQLGRTHSRVLGIESSFFELMGDSLIKTFQDRFTKLEQEFSIQLEDCWIKLYCFLANSIIQNGIDPVIQYDKPIVQHRKPSQMSSNISIDTVDQESLLSDKLSRSSSHSISLQSSTIPVLKKNTKESTREVFRNMRSNSLRSGDTTMDSGRSKTVMSKNLKKKDGTCIVM